jgi:phage terminase large subunit GpA-like protein
VIDTHIRPHATRELIKYIKKWKIDSYIPMPSEWAGENRYIPSGQSEYPGLIDHSIAPHMIEIQDCFHPDSGIKQVSIMKSTQSLATTTLENVMGHAIKYKLHNILYIISSLKIAKVRSSAAIDVMIDNSGLSEYIKPISTRMKRKIADNAFYKEMHGGRRLMMTSWNSIGDAKSLSWSLIIMDELDEAPYELAGQGDPEAIFAGRGKTIRDLKIAKISTPTTTQGRIYKNFLQGDQRYFFCECPLCGEKQVLVLMAGGRDHGLIARSESKEGVEQIIPDSVRYVCKFCKDQIYEYQKSVMLAGGEWRPTARPINPAYRSYQISNLMSPVMFYTWTQVMQEFAETDWGQNITKFKNFVIDVLGEPWQTQEKKKSWQELKQKAYDYPLGTEIPEGGCILTGGADIQKNRIELVVVAWGIGMSSTVIDYVIFWGEAKEKNGKVWQDFRIFLNSKKYKLKQVNLSIALTAIDTAYNPKQQGEERHNQGDLTTEHIVYDFVAMTPRTIAIRGNDGLKDRIIKEEKVHRKSLLKRRYDVAVTELKDETYIKCELPAGAQGEIRMSKHLPDDYFRGFLSEVYAETAPGKWGYKKVFDRNEPLDTYVYSRAAAEWLNLPTWTEQTWLDYERKLFS